MKMVKSVYPGDPRVTVYDFGDDHPTYAFHDGDGKAYLVSRDTGNPELWMLGPSPAPSGVRRDNALYATWEARLPRFTSVAEAIASILGEPRKGDNQ